MTTHQIIVGNVGTVCTTTDHALAAKEFAGWAETSKVNSGRAAGEPVTWMRDGEPYHEYLPPHPIDTLPDHELTAAQLQFKYSPNGDGEHPRFQRIDWQIAVGTGDTINGYWDWLRHQVVTEYENLPENQVNVYDFSIKVTAPAELSREDVHELLLLFSDAATDQLHDTQDDSGADPDERKRATQVLKLDVEVLS